MGNVSPVGGAFAFIMLGAPIVIIALSPSMAWNDWALLLAMMVGLTIIGQKARAIVRHNTPFYAVKNILAVGTGYGVLLAAVIFIATRPGLLWSPVPTAAVSILAWWGLQSAAYVGFQPHKIDWANKAPRLSPSLPTP